MTSGDLTSFGGRRPGDWTRDETIVALAACPTDRQRYNSRSRNVREVSELLGRSPGAVSKKFGNIWSLISGGEQGYPHAGQLVHQVFDEFRGRRRELLEEAAQIRLRFLEVDPLPRVELRVQLTLEEARGQIPARRRWILGKGIESRYFTVYVREGSTVIGYLFDFGALLGATGVVRHLLRRLLEEDADVVAVSRGLRLLLGGKTYQIAREAIQRNAPGFSPAELGSRGDVERFAACLSNTGPLPDGDPYRYAAAPVRKMSEGAQRKLVRYWLSIDPRSLSSRSLLIAAHVAWKAMKRATRR